MATKYYVGARYVPKFADPIDWNINTAYEALTVVNNNGFSYTSKKNVPAGISITNTEYWVMTGNYNAQISALRDDFDAYVTRTDQAIEDLGEAINYEAYTYFANKRIYIYGDSISSNETGSAFQPVWVRRLAERCPNTTVIMNYSEPGRYLTGVGGACGVISSQESIDADIILIFAGVNDWRHGVQIGDVSSNDITTIIGSLQVARSAIIQKCPTAKVFLMSPLKTYETNYPADHIATMPLILYRNVMRAFCGKYGWSYIDGFGAPMLDPENTTMHDLYQPDGLHCYPAYTNILCDYIANAFMNGSMPHAFNITRINLSPFVDADKFTLNFGYLEVDSEGNYTTVIAGTLKNLVNGNNKIMTLPTYLRDVFTANWTTFDGSGGAVYCFTGTSSGAVNVNPGSNLNSRSIQINGSGKLACSHFRTSV